MAVYQKKPKRDAFQDLMTILGIGAQAYGAWNQGQQFQQGRADTAAEGAATRAHDLKVLDIEGGQQRERDDLNAMLQMRNMGFDRDPTDAAQYRAPQPRGQMSQFTGDPDADLRRPPTPSSLGFTPDPSRHSTVGQERMGMWTKPDELEQRLKMNEAYAAAAPEGSRYEGFSSGGPRYGYSNVGAGGGGTAGPDMPKLRRDAANYANTKMSIHFPWYGKDQSLFSDITPEQRLEADAAYDNFVEMYMQQYGGGTRGPDVSSMSLLAAGLIDGDEDAEEALNVLVAEAPGLLADLKQQIETIQQIKASPVPLGLEASPIELAATGGSSTYSQTAPSNTMGSDMAAKQARLAELNQQLSQIYDPSLAWERDRIMKELSGFNG